MKTQVTIIIDIYLKILVTGHLLKNDVILFSRKDFCGLGLGLRLRLELAEICFRSNVHSGKCTRSKYIIFYESLRSFIIF